MYKKVILLMVAFFILFRVNTFIIEANDGIPIISVQKGQENMIVSSDSLIYINGESAYGLCTVNGEYYIPLELLSQKWSADIYSSRTYITRNISPDNLQKSGMKIIENSESYTKNQLLGINYQIIKGSGSYLHKNEHTIDYSFIPPNGKIMGAAVKTNIVVYSGQYYDATNPHNVENKFYNVVSIGGDYPLISMKDISEIIKVTYDANSNAFWVGEKTSLENKKHEKDLVGDYLHEIINEKMTDKEKVIAIHDFILAKMTYDVRVSEYGYGQLIISNWSEEKWNKFNKLMTEYEARGEAAYSNGFRDRNNISLYTGDGICQDYTSLFQAFCTRLGIPNIVITGSEMWHEWNKVYVGGEWLYVDCTYDDTGKSKTAYLLKDEQFMRKKHYILDKELKQFEDSAWAAKAISQNANTATATESKAIKVIFNSQELTFDMPIINKNDRTFYPFRQLLEDIGATVEWDETTKTATGILNNNHVEFQIGSNGYTLNGNAFIMDSGVSAFIDSGRTYIPIRYACEGLGFNVIWDENSNTIKIE